eukprot:TRINITY_DN41857_c0_g1_i1.p1 TRINITY_DN41857_c0_g1~~TRINITY_DN41857_c0_g1_i1.p1  ORF type:complete len:544 (-),score=65.10 TRINITY_DN41857_c0_g1_i1:534-2165(-)
MLAHHGYLALFVVPVLEVIWPSLDLVMPHIGPWVAHEKCPSCMERYALEYCDAHGPLSDVPYDAKTLYQGGGGNIRWNEHFRLEDFLQLLRAAFTQDEKVASADVHICIAAMWLCEAIMKINSRPLIVLDLVLHTINAPPELTSGHDGLDMFYEAQFHASFNLKQWAEGRLSDSSVRLRHLWIREEPLRGYAFGFEDPYTKSRMPGYARAVFYPYIYLPSLYIHERYAPASRGNVLVMREGSWPAQFANTLRGKLFFQVLEQFTMDDAPFRFFILPQSFERPSYRDMTRHRAAVFMPIIHFSKATFNDLTVMEIPLFMPDYTLQSSMSGQYICQFQYETSAPTWALEQCRWQEVARRLALAKYFRYPHVIRFASASDLVSQISQMDDSELTEISKKMASWNRGMLRDDMFFWQSSLKVLQYEDDVRVYEPVLPDEDAPLPEFELVHAPMDASCDTTLEAAHCSWHGRGEEWRDRCCQFVQQLTERLPGNPIRMPENILPDYQCLWEGPGGVARERPLGADEAWPCDSKTLSYANDLLAAQRFP